jgi:outer membrane protein assembly factor BamE (lipoprotein component of BamABCDE complex)
VCKKIYFLIPSIFYVLLCGCSNIIEQKGCFIQAFDLSEVKENVDTKETVENKYGMPSTTSIFQDDSERWYYIYRVISDSPTKGKKSILHKSVIITFNKNGIVKKKEIISGENEMEICKEVTKEKGYKTTFLKESFRNIGKFSQSGHVS